MVLTGSYADANGIVSNFWYDAAARREVYCASDTPACWLGLTAKAVPHYLIDSTFGRPEADQPRTRRSLLSRGRTGRDMPGGHLADGVYWTQDTYWRARGTITASCLSGFAGSTHPEGQRLSGEAVEPAAPGTAYAAGPDDSPTNGMCRSRTDLSPSGSRRSSHETCRCVRDLTVPQRAALGVCHGGRRTGESGTHEIPTCSHSAFRRMT